MTTGLTKKEMIFQLYAGNLKMLSEQKLIVRTPDNALVYICPGCLTEFSTCDDGKNHLTLEHVPPDKLGGKANILTCAKCNNESGHEIDADLIGRLRQIDNEKLLPGSEMKVHVKINNEVIRGTLTVQEGGDLVVEHSKKNNHPKKLEEAMKHVAGGLQLEADYIKNKINTEHLEYALLKIGYLMVFEKFGYSLILDKCFDDVREQVLNPHKRIYPPDFWIMPEYGKEMTGVYFITTEGMESLLAIFSLSTEKTEWVLGTILPLPARPVAEVVKLLNDKVNAEDKFDLTLYPLEQNTDYLYNIENIQVMLKWLDNRKK